MPEEMTEEEAFAILFNLAEQNALDPDNCEFDLVEEAKKQHEALMICRHLM